jgi:hypothetical protein
MIIEPIGIKEIFVDGTGNFQLKNGVIRFVCYSEVGDGDTTQRIATVRIIVPVSAVVSSGAEIRALLGDKAGDLVRGMAWN